MHPDFIVPVSSLFNLLPTGGSARNGERLHMSRDISDPSYVAAEAKHSKKSVLESSFDRRCSFSLSQPNQLTRQPLIH